MKRTHVLEIPLFNFISIEFQQRIEMLIRHGKQCSHLTEKFPECKPYDLKPRMPPEGWLEMKAKLDAEEQL